MRPGCGTAAASAAAGREYPAMRGARMRPQARPEPAHLAAWQGRRAPRRGDPMPSAAYAKEFLARLRAAWDDGEFAESASRAASASIHSDLLGGAGAAPVGGACALAPQQLVQNATIMSFMTERISIEAGPWEGLPEEATAGALRLARLWEALSKTCPPGETRMFALNAACAYEIAGHQAGAQCMAGRADAGQDGGGGAGLPEVAGLLLQRRFVRLRSRCDQIAREPDYDKVENIRHSLAMASAAAGLSAFAGHMLSGSRPDMGSIVGDLDDAEKLFHASGFYAESSLAYAVKGVLGSMWSRSTWSVIGGRAGGGGGGFAWSRYLALLSRGLGTPVPSGSSISDVWPSQLEAVRGGILSSGGSKVVRMPAGAGRDRVAEMSIMRALAAGPAAGSRPLCVYVAPHCALASEAARSLSLVFSDLGFSVACMDGAYDAAPPDADGCGGGGRPDILVATPEGLDALARTSRGSLDGAALFVVDEARATGDGARGIRIEMLLTRLRRRFPESRFVLLSSALSDDAMRRFAAWMRCGGGGGGGIIAADWRPATQRMAKLEWAHGRCRLVHEPQDADLWRRGAAEFSIAARELCADARTGRKRAGMPSCPERDEIAAGLALRCSALGPVLVYTASPAHAVPVARRMLDRARRQGGDEDAARPFQDRAPPSAAVSAEWLGPAHEVTRLLRSGIAVLHGGLPGALRRAIESDARGGDVGAVVSAETPSQGAGIPVRTIIVHSCRLRGAKGGRAERLPDGEYRSLAGMAGRPGRDTEGAVIHVVMSPSDAVDYEHYASVRNRHDDADSSLRRLLADMARGGMSDDDLARALDPVILGIVAEEGARGGCEGIVRDVVADSLAAQGPEADPDIERACDLVESRAKSIVDGAPGPAGGAMLRAYGGTGLGMRSCAIIQERVDENRDALLALLSPEKAGRACDLARLIMGSLGGVSEMDGELEYGGDRDGLLGAWMAGSTVHGALEEAGAGAGDVEGAARFVGTAFGHYLPWGVSAFVRIAAARLGIDEGGLPDHVRYLPEMVRHGVPAPEHSWAMRLGVPTRRAAMRVCSSLRPSTPRELARKISGMGPESLAEHGIAAGAAADIAGAARRMDVNPLLREGRSLEEVVREPARIVGAGADQWCASRPAEGGDVEIKRDYGDLADRNAMAAYAGGRHVGYVEGRAAQYLAPLVDAGMKVSARVAGAGRGGGDTPPRITVRLSAGGGGGCRGRRGPERAPSA